MKRFLLFAMTIVFAMHLSAQEEVTYAVGEYSTETSSYVPVFHYFDYSYSQSIYPADSLQPGMITAISYKYASGVTEIIPSVIYMGTVERSEFNNNTDWVPVSELTQVFSGDVTFSNGWVRIELDEPYLYIAGNLVVAYTNERGSYTDYRNFNAFHVSSSSLYCYRDNNIISASNPPSGNKINYVPSTRFHFSGEAIDICYPPMNLTVSNITSTSADVTWTANENSTSSEYGIAYKTKNSADWIELDNVSGESSMSIANLEPYQEYEIKVWTICSEGNSNEVSTSFTTAFDESLIQTIPYNEDFDDLEDISEWRIINGNATNKWYHGALENNTMTEDGTLTEGGAMYVSNDGGSSNVYDNDSTSIAYFVTFVEFGNGPEFKLTFDRKQLGENGYDYARVYLMDVNAELSNTVLPNESYAITDELEPTGTTVAEWVNEEVFIPNTYVNTTKKLVFVWNNDYSGGTNPPAAIDNIAITELTCGQVSDLLVQAEDMGGTVNANVSFTDNNMNSSEYIVEYRLDNETEWTSYISSDNPVVVPNLLYGSTYELRVKIVCDNADTSFVSNVVIFNTPCATITDFPYVMSFENTFQTADGMIGNRSIPLCWYNINGGYNYYYWTSSDYEYYDGGRSLYYSGTYSSSNNYSFSDWIISPVFELTGNERLNFMAKAVEESIPAIVKIYAKNVTDEDITSMADTAGFTLVETIDLTASNDYELYEVGLTSCLGNTRIALVVNESSSTFYIDSLTVSILPDCPNVYGVNAYPASSDGIAVDFNTSNGNGSGWVIAYGQATSAEAFDPETAESITVFTANDLPFVIEGLNAGETYYFAVKQNCDGEFSDIVSCKLPIIITLPYEQYFEDTENVAEWEFTSSDINEWFIGTAVSNIEGNMGSLYVTNDNGVTNAYTTPDAYNYGNVYASTIIEFGEGEGYMLSYDWKAGGNYNNYLKIYLMPTNIELSNTSLPSSSYEITSNKFGSDSWVRDTVLLDNSYSNTVKKLVFMWCTYGSYNGTVYNPPAAIDNIKFEVRNCVEITDLALTAEDGGESANITVSFTDPNEAGNYVIEYKSSDVAEWTVLTDISDNPYTIEELSYATQYDVRVKAVCSDEYSSNYVQSSIRTSCAILPLPWTETFDTDVTDDICWSEASGLLPDGTIQSSSFESYSSAWEHNSSAQINGTADSRMRINLWSDDYADWLITPSVDLGDGSTTYQIAADVILTAWNSDSDPEPASDDRFAILVSTDNGVSWSSTNAIIYADGDNDTEHNFSDFGRTPTRVTFKLVDADENPITGQVKFAFYGESTQDNGDNHLYIDNVEVSEWNECPVPYALTVSNIGTETATVSFNEAGNATEWEYVLLENGETDPEEGSPLAVTENPIELTGLFDGTVYAIAVRSVCDDYSPWSAVVSFTTATALPYSTTFANETDNASWDIISSGTNSWAIGTATAEDAGGMSAYVSNDGGTTYAATSESSIIYMKRLVDFGDGSVTYNLDFDYKVSGYIEGNNVYSGIYVYALEPTTNLSASVLPNEDEVALLYGEENWTHATIELTGLSGIKQMVFATKGYTYESALAIPAAIDNISIDESPCTVPTEIVVSSVTESTANISWTGTSDNYVIYYRPVDGTDEDIQSVEAEASPFILTDLLPSTDYCFAIRGICGLDSSIYTDYYLFRTTCIPVSELPWSESFESITANNELPACMEATGLGTYVKTYISAQDNYNQSARTGDKFASFRYGSDNYIFTPTFELIGGNEYTFSFWYKTDGYEGWNTLEAKLCSGQTTEDIIATIGTIVSSPVNDVYQEYVGTFTPEEDGVYSIAIHCVSTYNPMYLSIDDLSLSGDIESEPCVEPTSLTVTNITETTAELTWTAGGSESSWQVRLGEDGEAVDVTATSHTFTELTAGTQYTAYVRANCGESYSSWVSVAFTTASEGVVNPVVTTVAASNVTETEATLNATVVEGTETITARGFKYKTTESTDWTDVAATGTTTLTATLTDLTPATSYEFKAYVTVGTEEFEGAVLTFTTEGTTVEIVMGTVETNEASDINDHTAVLHGTLTSNGGDDSYTVGFLMSTMEDFDMETPNVVTLTATENAGALTANATGLESGTNYFFRAYITNDAGTAYGDIKTFVTTSGLSDAEGGLSVVIYPNPASGKATIEIEGLNESARLIVTDLQGRVLSSDDLRSGAKTYEMDLTGLASGVYYIRIVTDNAVSTQKLIVK